MIAKKYQTCQQAIETRFGVLGDQSRHLFIAAICTCLAFSPTMASGQSQSDDEAMVVRNLWPEDILIEDAKAVPVVESSFTELWLDTLGHDENDLKQELISQMEQLHEIGVDQSAHLERIRGLVDDENHHTVNVALASLLVALDDEASKELLFGMIRPSQIEISQIVEPAFARWKYEPAIELWRDRLKDQQRVRRVHLILAIEGLGVVGDQESLESLVEITTDFHFERPSIRLAAARAAGAIGGDGLVEKSVVLAESRLSNPSLNQLCAVALLAKQDSAEAISLLQKLMVRDLGAVAGAAWNRMVEIDSAQALPFTEECASSEDPIVREAVVKTWFEQPSVERIVQIGGLLNDRHPDVRLAARVSLRRLASRSEEFGQAVRDVAMKVIYAPQSNFGGLEECLILLAALDHKPVAERAVELLSHDRPEVYITAAWALRKLQVEEMNERMLRYATRISDREIAKFRSATRVSLFHLEQVAHLFDAFGETGYREAEGVLRKFIPLVHDPMDAVNPTGVGPNSRSAAITALGKLYSDDPDRELVSQFVERMNARGRDGGYDIPEVWATSAKALGRMKAASALDELRKYYTGGPPVDGVNYAAAWSIQKLTGESFPPPVPRVVKLGRFDLKPIDDRLEPSKND